MMLSITSSERFIPDSASVATTICFTYSLRYSTINSLQMNALVFFFKRAEKLKLWHVSHKKLRVKQQKGESDFIIRIHAKAGVLPLSVRLGTGCCTGPASQLTRLSPLQPTSKPLNYDSTIAKACP